MMASKARRLLTLQPIHTETMLRLKPPNPAFKNISKRLLATLADSEPVLGLDEAALDALPAPQRTSNGLLPTSPSTRTSRLEYHYINTIKEDQMILHYDHASKLIRSLEENPEWSDGLKAPEDLISRVFGVQDPIARDRVKGGGPKRYGN
jgi:hypothetical protein